MNTDRRSTSNPSPKEFDAAEFDALLVAVLAEDATHAEHEQLIAIVAGNPQRTQRYVELTHLHAQLQWSFGNEPLAVGRQPLALSSPEPEERTATGSQRTASSPTPQPKKSWLDRASKRPVRPALAVAVLFTVAVVGWMAVTYFPERVAESGGKDAEPQQPEFVAWYMGAHNAEWLDGTEPERTKLMPGQRLAIAKGLIEIQYRTRAVVVIEGPAVFEVLGEKSGYLQAGKLTGRVEDEEAKGFVIDTPLVLIEDLGTEFTAAVMDSGQLDLTVSEGSVELFRDETSLGVIAAGQSWRHTRGAGGQMFASATIAPVRMPDVPTPGIRYVHWSFDSEQEDRQLVDSGEGFAGGPFHIPYNSQSKTVPRHIDGRHGRAMSFDGVDDSLRTEFSGIGAGNPRTVACWVRIPQDVKKESHPIIGWGTPRSLGTKWQVCWNPTRGQGPVGALRCEVGYGWIVGGPDLRDGKWHHVAAVLPRSSSPNVSDVRLYVDGQAVKPLSVEPMPLHTGNSADGDLPIVIGRAVQNASSRFRGDIDEVFVFDRPLNEKQLQQLMLGENIAHSNKENAQEN